MELIEEKSDKDWLAVVLFCFFIGTLGIHRFYVGKPISGIFMILTFGGFGIWWLIDLIMIVTENFTDGEGRRVRNVRNF